MKRLNDTDVWLRLGEQEERELRERHHAAITMLAAGVAPPLRLDLLADVVWPRPLVREAQRKALEVSLRRSTSELPTAPLGTTSAGTPRR
jgi:hypothetical protein